MTKLMKAYNNYIDTNNEEEVIEYNRLLELELSDSNFDIDTFKKNVTACYKNFFDETEETRAEVDKISEETMFSFREHEYATNDFIISPFLNTSIKIYMTLDEETRMYDFSLVHQHRSSVNYLNELDVAKDIVALKFDALKDTFL